MGFTDKMCWTVAKQIIDTIFMKKYTIDNTKHWYEDLNEFIVKEWNIIHDRPYDETDARYKYFNDDEEEAIIYDAFHILLETINVDEDDYEDNSEDVSWDRFDEIISSYLYNEIYDLEQNNINLNLIKLNE
jgi:hypothetical protein